MLIKLTQIDKRCPEYVSPWTISHVYKENDDPVGATIVILDTRQVLKVRESAKEISDAMKVYLGDD